MSEQTQDRPLATMRRSRWPGWIWAIPLAAIAITGWLVAREMLNNGPEITITFARSGGMKAGDTEIHYKGLTVGTVKKLALSGDGSHVIATAQMKSDVAGMLRRNTRFWLVGNQVGLTNLSSLKTLIAGPHIEMAPGSGKPAHQFQGRLSPPPVGADAKGTGFVLHAARLGSLSKGAPVTYLGLEVGTVTRTHLDDGGNGFRVHVFVRAPYDKLVHDGSRFWNAGGVHISAGGGGLQASVGSLSSLLSGAVAFETPTAAATGTPSKSGHRFTLYDNKAAAETAPSGPTQRYLLRFTGAVGGLSVGAPVKLRGFTVGRVAKVRLKYDAVHDTLETPVTIVLDAAKFGLADGGKTSNGAAATKAAGGAGLDAAVRTLVGQGLRAHLDRSPPLIGGRYVALAIDPGAASAHLNTSGHLPVLPTAAASNLAAIETNAAGALSDIRRMDLPALAQQVRGTVKRIEALASSPKLENSLGHLDRSLANIQRITANSQGKIGPAITSLRRAADQAQAAVTTANDVLGGSAGPTAGTLPAALAELTSAARSINALARYLERHPAALLQGRSGP